MRCSVACRISRSSRKESGYVVVGWTTLRNNTLCIKSVT
jgi:hypothetical protein